ncbi:MAG: TraR/DksA C4-type zinc finger protein [Verrucomicrobiia bacterium]
MKKHKKIANKKRTAKHLKVRRAKSAKPVRAAKIQKAKPVANKVQTPPPAEQPRKVKLPKEQVAKYKRLLMDLRDHLIDEVSFLSTDNLKRSQRDVSGELSGYSLHMADAGTDNFDREFALSLVSNEQEALYEIEEALKRLEQSTFGLCEMCEKPIRKERLSAVPFARLCVRCQSDVEKNRHRPAQATALFGEAADEEGGEAEEAEE